MLLELTYILLLKCNSLSLAGFVVLERVLSSLFNFVLLFFLMLITLIIISYY